MIDIGTAAQWAAVAVALALGIRAEIRDVRQRRSDTAKSQAVAHSGLTALLGDAIASLPAEISDGFRLSTIRETLTRLSTESRRVVEHVAAAFPDAGGWLLELSDRLEDLIALADQSDGHAKTELMKLFYKIYLSLTHLSITAVTRIRLRGDSLS